MQSDPENRIEKPKGSMAYELFRFLMLSWYRVIGWKIVGSLPSENKFVVIAAPHTSNWDLPLMLAVALSWRVKLHWMGKKEIFNAPFGGLMHRLGGISIDRSSSHDVVAQMVQQFNEKIELAVAIPPEGTRDRVKYWKTGFYHIAHQAKVPIVLGFLDYEKKIGGIDRIIYPSGDYDADMVEIRAFYSSVRGKYADLGRPK